MSHIRSTNHAAVVLVKYGPDGVYLDRCFDVSSIVNGSIIAILAKEKLTGVVDEASRCTVEFMRTIDLRTRFDAAVEGPYLIHLNDPVDFHVIQNCLQAMPSPRLKAFLQAAKI